jgi:tripartite-type tricarboxylate transporter receptor subunit TctC
LQPEVAQAAWEETMSRRSLVREASAIAATLAIFTVPCAAEDTWPTRPMTMIIPFAAGGSVDPLGRVLASGLSQVLGQRVIVENVGGAGGTVGTNRVAKAAPDGYQFVFGSGGSFAQSQSLYRHPAYNTLTDFAPVALVAQQPVLLVARKDLPVRGLQEFIAYAKANEGKMQYGSPGVGSLNHLGCVLLNAAIGIHVMHVAYRGGGPAMQDLIGGRTDYQCPNDVLAAPLITAGTIKGIAVLSRERSTALPDLATAAEQGVADVDVANWFALALPRATAPDIVRKLNVATLAALDTPAVQEQMGKIGGNLVASERRSPEYLQKFFESEIARWAPVVRQNALVLD